MIIYQALFVYFSILIAYLFVYSKLAQETTGHAPLLGKS